MDHKDLERLATESVKRIRDAALHGEVSAINYHIKVFELVSSIIPTEFSMEEDPALLARLDELEICRSNMRATVNLLIQVEKVLLTDSDKDAVLDEIERLLERIKFVEG